MLRVMQRSLKHLIALITLITLIPYLIAACPTILITIKLRKWGYVIFLKWVLKIEHHKWNTMLIRASTDLNYKRYGKRNCVSQFKYVSEPSLILLLTGSSSAQFYWY